MFLSSFLTARLSTSLPTQLVFGTSIVDGEDERESIASALSMFAQEKADVRAQRNITYSNTGL